MSKSQAKTQEEAFDLMYPKPCKKNGDYYELECQKDSSKKREFLDELAKIYSTCGCDEDSHCFSPIEYGDAKQWAKCVETCNRRACTTFPNGIQHHYLLNFGYLSCSSCSCRVIFPYTQKRSCGTIVGEVQHPFLEPCEGKLFVCP